MSLTTTITKLIFEPSNSPNPLRKSTGQGYLIFNPNTNTFSCECSSIPNDPDITREVDVVNIETGKTIRFKSAYTNKDADGDIAGWHYVSANGAKFPCKLLIIND